MKAVKRIIFLFLIFSIVPTGLMAADKVVVIPLISHQKTINNVITVAKSGGDFTDPLAAVASITDADENQPYLIIIAPGIYSLTAPLVMKPYVDISGTGKGITKLVGAISTDNADAGSTIVWVKNNVMLSNLDIVNTGGGDYSFGIYAKDVNETVKLYQLKVTAAGGREESTAIYNSSSSLELIDLTAESSGWYNVYGVHNVQSTPKMFHVQATATNGYRTSAILNVTSSPVMRAVTAYASFSRTAYGYVSGIQNKGSSHPLMTDVKATANGGTYINGILNEGASSPTMNNVIAEAIGTGTSNTGISLDWQSNPIMTDVTITAFGGTTNIGLSCNRGSIPIIRRCTISGTDYAILDDLGQSFGSIKISQSTLIGTVKGNDTYKCVACDDNNGEVIPTDCGRIDL